MTAPMHTTSRIIRGSRIRLVAGIGLALVASVVLSAAAAAATTVKPLKAKPLPRKPPVMKAPPKELTAIQKELQKIQVKTPSFDFSRSPIPSLKISALRFDIPKLPTKGLMKNVANPFKGMAVAPSVKAPSPTIDVAAVIAAMTPQIPPPSVVPPAVPVPPVAPPAPAPAPQPAVNAPPQPDQATCAQFASMPSAQYCSSVGDPNGAALCQQCKAAGF